MFIRKRIPQHEAPGKKTLATILKKEFKLKYFKSAPENAKYNDPIFDEKR